MATLLGAIAGVATIVGGIVWIVKYSAWGLRKTPEEKKEAIDADTADKQKKAEETGRPV